VWDLFEAILHKDDKFAREVQLRLDPSVFVNAFFTQLQTAGQQYQDAVAAEDVELRLYMSMVLTGLYKLTPSVWEVPSFQSELSSIEPIDLLTFPWVQASVPLKNAQWHAVSCLIKGPSAAEFFANLGYCDLLINLFHDLEQGFCAYHESALKVLSLGIRYSDVLRDRLVEVDFFFMLASLISACATHGICHGAILRLLQENIAIPEVWTALTSFFLEIARQGLSGELPIEFRSFAWQTIKIIYDAQPLVMEQLEEDVRTDFETLRQIVEKSYGGVVPPEARITDPALAAVLATVSNPS
jgi:hypothetical protein